MGLGEWLRGLGLGRYDGVLHQNEIDGSVLPDLTEGDFEKLGLPMGHRKCLLKAIANLGATGSAARPESPAASPPTDAAERVTNCAIRPTPGTTLDLSRDSLALVIEAVRKLPSDRAAIQADVRELIDRVTIGRTAIQVQLSESTDTAAAEVDTRTLTVPWMPPSPYRNREIIQGVADGKTSARPIRANARAILLGALGDAHRWLDELLSDPVQTSELLALREGKTDRSIRMTLSLSFLAPDIVKAAIEGRLPRGYGLKRLVDLPMAWPDQWRVLGLEAPAHA